MLWVERLAPDIVATLRRFPFAILLNAVALVLLLGGINELLFVADNETGARLTAGFATGAIFAVAGQLFREAQPDRRVLGAVLAFGLPVLVVAAFQIRDVSIVVPFALPVVGVMWASVAAFTRPGQGAERRAIQDRFWWLNYRAILGAAIAVSAGLLVLLGLASIERALSILFGVEIGDVVYRWLLPVVTGFLVPAYWLSTLPRIDAVEPAPVAPDVVAGAGGFAAQFIAAPLLLVYGAILHAYALQIALTQTLPQGLLGWMVLGFVVAGAATWLALDPPFLRERLVPRLFRRFWYWVTLVPLVLLAIAVFVRLDAYGLTLERVVVALGGLWAASLAGVFLTGRGDIRLVPGLAGVVLALFSVGPWNMANLPNLDQAGRLEAALAAAGADLDWSPETAASARSAISYLHDFSGEGALRRVLSARAVDVADMSSSTAIFSALGLPEANAGDGQTSISGARDVGTPVDVSATPLLLGPLSVSADYETTFAGYRFQLVDNALVVRSGAVGGDSRDLARADLAGWASRQAQGTISDPFVDVVIEGRAHRLAVDSVLIDTSHQEVSETRRVRSLQGILFAAEATATPSP